MRRGAGLAAVVGVALVLAPVPVRVAARSRLRFAK